MRIAVVGSGVSGLVAARELHRAHAVTVFEADARLGGHANTVDVELGCAHHAVDTGFIVYNDRNYPGFSALLDDLGVATQPTQMSFGVSDARSGLEYRGSSANTLFAQRRNLVRPTFLRLVAEIVRFNRAALRTVGNDAHWTGADRLVPPAQEMVRSDREDPDESIGDFVLRERYSRAFVDQFLVPLGSAVWSAEPETFLSFPMRSYARFMHNHGMLGVRRHARWRTVTGGSRTYVAALAAPFAHRIRLGTPVHKVTSPDTDDPSGHVELLTDDGPARFDRVVLATHSDQALALLGDASAAVRSVLGSIRYQANTATLHTDASLLPRTSRAWASWNYHVDPGSSRAKVTYWMNELQSIDASETLLVSLNRAEDVDPGRVLAQFEYEHPVFDAVALRAQRRRAEIQGVGGVWFAGAYWGYGFHEDGVQSALEVAGAIGEGR
jgi:uncharacterized protein